MAELTQRQADILAFIRKQIGMGLPPTLREICAEFGFVSTNAANDHLVALEKKGFIRRGTRSRGIFLVAADGSTAAPPEYLVRTSSRARRPKMHRGHLDRFIATVERFVAERPFACPELIEALQEIKDCSR